MDSPEITLLFPSLSESERMNIDAEADGGVKFGLLPPLGIAYIAAFLREHGFRPSLIDTAAMNLGSDGILRSIGDSGVPVVGLSVLTATFDKAKSLSAAISGKYPDKLVLIGGHHVSLIREKVLDAALFDIAVMGEGEVTMLELMRLFKRHGYDKQSILADADSLRMIKGIFFRDGGRVVFTGLRPLILDLDVLPVPARDLLPMERYIPLPIEYKRLPVVHVMVSRGCPFNCTYCSTHAIFGWRVRSKSPEAVVGEIRHLVEKYGAKQISFWDDNLTVNREWINKLCNLLIEAKLDVIWNCYSHVTTVDFELLKLMKQAGCFCIWYGIESGNEELLKIINKVSSLELVEKAVAATHKAGIETRGLFMLGLPGETPEMARKTVDFAVRLDVDYAQFSLTTPHIGTKLYEDARQYGTLNEDYSKFTQSNCVFVPKGYKNSEELVAMRRYAYRKFYLRPSYVVKSLARLRSADDFKRLLKGVELLFKLG